MKRLLTLGLLFAGFLAIAPAGAQHYPPAPPVVTYPLNTGTNGTNIAGSGTLPLTNNLAIAANLNRRACLIYNNGTNSIQIATNSSMTGALTVAAKTPFNCNLGGTVMGDSIYVTGTSGDVVSVWWQ